jgi:hypothetical protein
MKTAVEWFANRISHGGLVTKKQFDELLEQAKEMEKERVIDFAKKFSDFNGLTFNEKEVSKEYLEKLYDEYYNETFKSEQ